jgi:hypothetical protein
MECPCCDLELDPDLEQPAGMYGPWAVGEITCQGCGAVSGLVHGHGALEAITAALERLARRRDKADA